MMTAIVALMPLILALFLFIAFRLSSQIVGLVTLCVTLALVIVYPPFHLSPVPLALSLGSGVARPLTLLIVLLPALFLYHSQRAGGAITVLSERISRIIPDQDLLVLLLVFGIAPFLDAVCGMNIGIFVVAPLLLSLRILPLRVACLCMISQVTSIWGTMGEVTYLVSRVTEVTDTVVGSDSAILLMPVMLSLCTSALLLSGRSVHEVRRVWLPIVGTALTWTIGAWVATRLVGVELVGILMSLATVVFLALLSRVWIAISLTQLGTFLYDRANQPVLWRSGLPYALLTVLLLTLRIVPPLRDWLQSLVVFSIPEIGLTLSIFSSPGLWLVVMSFVSLLLLRLTGNQIRKVASVAWKQFPPIALALLCFSGAVQTMQDSGMVSTVGQMVSVLGSHYVWVSPWLGAFSGWATGSVFVGNSLFAPFQKSAALQAGLSDAWVVAAQNTGSSLGMILSPTSVALSMSVSGVAKQEGVVLRKFGLLVLWAIVLLMSVMSVIALPSIGTSCVLILAIFLPILLAVIKYRSVWVSETREMTAQAVPEARGDMADPGGTVQIAPQNLGKRSRDLLEHLAQAPQGMSRSQLSTALGQPTGVVYRLLHTLQEQGYIQRESATGQYRLAHLGAQESFSTTALPVQKLTGPPSAPTQGMSPTLWQYLLPDLEALAESLKEVAYLTVLGESQVIPVAVAVPERLLCCVIKCGHPLPLHCSGCGRVWLAYQREEVRTTLIQNCRVTFTDVDPNQMALEAQLVRHCGYAVDDDELEVGMRSFAVPLQDARGVLIAALAISGPVRRLPLQMRNSIIEELRRTSTKMVDTLRRVA